jgi:hypothetical protein
MEPHAELPGKPEAQQCSAMVPRQAVVGIVACLANLSKQRPNVAWNDALVLQSPDQIDLLLVGRREDSHVRRRELREQFRQLAELQKAGVRIVGKVALGEHPEAHELLIVRLEMSEVRWLVAEHWQSWDGGRRYFRVVVLWRRPLGLASGAAMP